MRNYSIIVVVVTFYYRITQTERTLNLIQSNLPSDTLSPISMLILWHILLLIKLMDRKFSAIHSSFFGVSNYWNLLLQPTSSSCVLTGLTKETNSPLSDDKVGEEAEIVRIYRLGAGTPQVRKSLSEEGNIARLNCSELGIRDLVGGGAVWQVL